MDTEQRCGPVPAGSRRSRCQAAPAAQCSYDEMRPTDCRCRSSGPESPRPQVHTVPADYGTIPVLR